MDLGIYEVECIKCGAKFDLPSHLSEKRSGMKRVKMKKISVFKDKACVILEKAKKGEIVLYDIEGRSIDPSELPDPTPKIGSAIDLNEVKSALEQIPRFGRVKVDRDIEFFVNNDNAEIEEIDLVDEKGRRKGKKIKLKNPYVVGNPVELELESDDVEIVDMEARIEIEKDKNNDIKRVVAKCPECNEVVLIWEK